LRPVTFRLSKKCLYSAKWHGSIGGMKKDIHPAEYRPVVFHDLASGAEFLIGSTIATTETCLFEGKKYPKATVEISSKSHPFYTGEDRMLDKTGRVERFKKRAAQKK